MDFIKKAVEIAFVNPIPKNTFQKPYTKQHKYLHSWMSDSTKEETELWLHMKNVFIKKGKQQQMQQTTNCTIKPKGILL